MANNIYIWSTDSSLWESCGADIIYLATTPGANGEAGGQSKNIVGNNQTLQSTPLKDALLDIGSDNLVTLAGNYTGADGRTPYNLNYTAKLTLKEISGVQEKRTSPSDGKNLFAFSFFQRVIFSGSEVYYFFQHPGRLV